jgi:hypothetical protein
MQAIGGDEAMTAQQAYRFAHDQASHCLVAVFTHGRGHGIRHPGPMPGSRQAWRDLELPPEDTSHTAERPILSDGSRQVQASDVALSFVILPRAYENVTRNIDHRLGKRSAAERLVGD